MVGCDTGKAESGAVVALTGDGRAVAGVARLFVLGAVFDIPFLGDRPFATSLTEDT